MEKAGLIIAQSRTNGYYDRFRKRVIFPIFDSKGDCIAFGGRALPGEDEVKYLKHEGAGGWGEFLIFLAS